MPKVEVTANNESVPPPAERVIRFPVKGNGSTIRTFNFAPWYGVGVDEITYACQRQIERFLVTRDNDLTPATIGRYCYDGLRYFLGYCRLTSEALGRPMGLVDITRDLIESFLSQTRSEGRATGFARMIYKSAKAVLVALGKRGLVPQDIWPKNPFPNSGRSAKCAAPFTTAERKQLAAALKTAVMPLFNDDAEPTSELLVYCLLAIALRTGRNTTPLLEMTTDCLKDHFLPNRSILVVYKRRGYSSQYCAVREFDDIEIMVGVLPDTARIIRRVVDLTERLRPDAPPHLRECLWLCRSGGSTNFGTVSTLSLTMLSGATQKLVKGLGLVDGEGKPLQVNVSRFRKTFVNRVFELAGNDPVAAAEAAGNTLAVADTNYLSPPPEAKVQFRLMGEVLTQSLLSADSAPPDRTPVGRCRDTQQGEFAPRDGSACTSFLNCMRCRSYVVSGDDLHRLFSFYWLLIRERERMDKNRWKRQFAHIIRSIDRDIAEAGVRDGKFSADIVTEARSRAKVEPHPFWASPGLLGTMT